MARLGKLLQANSLTLSLQNTPPAVHSGHGCPLAHRRLAPPPGLESMTGLLVQAAATVSGGSGTRRRRFLMQLALARMKAALYSDKAKWVVDQKQVGTQSDITTKEVEVQECVEMLKDEVTELRKKVEEGETARNQLTEMRATMDTIEKKLVRVQKEHEDFERNMKHVKEVICTIANPQNVEVQEGKGDLSLKAPVGTPFCDWILELIVEQIGKGKPAKIGWVEKRVLAQFDRFVKEWTSIGALKWCKSEIYGVATNEGFIYSRSVSCR